MPTCGPPALKSTQGPNPISTRPSQTETEPASNELVSMPCAMLPRNKQVLCALCDAQYMYAECSGMLWSISEPAE